MEAIFEFINQNIWAIICGLLISLSFIVMCISGISTMVCSSFNDQRMAKFHSKVLKISSIITFMLIFSYYLYLM